MYVIFKENVLNLLFWGLLLCTVNNDLFLLFLFSKVEDRRLGGINVDQFTVEASASGQIKCVFSSVITEIGQTSILPSLLNSLLTLCSLKRTLFDQNVMNNFYFYCVITKLRLHLLFSYFLTEVSNSGSYPPASFAQMYITFWRHPSSKSCLNTILPPYTIDIA